MTSTATQSTTKQPPQAETRRVAMVTGRAHGIGAAAVRRPAADGHAVTVLDLNEADSKVLLDEIEQGGGRAFAPGADASSEVDV